MTARFLEGRHGTNNTASTNEGRSRKAKGFCIGYIERFSETRRKQHDYDRVRGKKNTRPTERNS
jgi:hypothetical protein